MRRHLPRAFSAAMMLMTLGFAMLVGAGQARRQHANST